MTTPVRIQRSRRKGSKLTSPNGLPVVCVTRGTRWGNPYTLPMVEDIVGAYDCATRDPRKRAVEAYRDALIYGALDVTVEDVRRELAGKNLACWCRIKDSHGEPVLCHADVLLEVANAVTPAPNAMEGKR